MDRLDAGILSFFEKAPGTLPLYLALEEKLRSLCPAVEIRVQKTQISFYAPCLFAMAWLPRRKADREQGMLGVSFGLNRRDGSPRITEAVEPYPGRWTHHLLLAGPEELDAELLSWLEEALAFSQIRRPREKKRG